MLRPGGRFHLLEHGLAPDARVAAFQRRVEPLQRRVADGCHLTRDPVDLATTAGFTVEDLEQKYGAGPKAWAYLTRAATVRDVSNGGTAMTTIGGAGGPGRPAGPPGGRRRVDAGVPRAQVPLRRPGRRPVRTGARSGTGPPRRAGRAGRRHCSPRTGSGTADRRSAWPVAGKRSPPAWPIAHPGVLPAPVRQAAAGGGRRPRPPDDGTCSARAPARTARRCGCPATRTTLRPRRRRLAAPSMSLTTLFVSPAGAGWPTRTRLTARRTPSGQGRPVPRAGGAPGGPERRSRAPPEGGSGGGPDRQGDRRGVGRCPTGRSTGGG